jgi:hypothetical protein
MSDRSPIQRRVFTVGDGEKALILSHEGPQAIRIMSSVDGECGIFSADELRECIASFIHERVMRAFDPIRRGEP